MVTREIRHELEEFRDGMPFVGGSLWLDFLNTCHPSRGDFIATPEAAARWLSAAGLACDCEHDAVELSLVGMRLRNALRGLFEALSLGVPAPAPELSLLNATLAAATYRNEVMARDVNVVTSAQPVARIGPLARIALDFAAFAPACQAHRLRECARDGCTMVFYDGSRNAARRWCTMSRCGNRSKIQTFRAKGESL